MGDRLGIPGAVDFCIFSSVLLVNAASIMHMAQSRLNKPVFLFLCKDRYQSIATPEDLPTSSTLSLTPERRATQSELRSFPVFDLCIAVPLCFQVTHFLEGFPMLPGSKAHATLCIQRGGVTHIRSQVALVEIPANQ